MPAVTSPAQSETRIRGSKLSATTRLGPWLVVSSTLRWGSAYSCDQTPSATTDQRYYARTIGRFTTTDPYGGSARPGNPQSWNRYLYVGGHPSTGMTRGGRTGGILQPTRFTMTRQNPSIWPTKLGSPIHQPPTRLRTGGGGTCGTCTSMPCKRPQHRPCSRLRTFLWAWCR